MTRLLNRRAVRVALLAALVLLGAVLRLTDINWDRYQHMHPDERFIVWVASTMRWPSGEPGADGPNAFLGELGAALDPARSPLNPLRWSPDAGENAGKVRNYAYGHFPLYLLLGVANVAAALGRGDWGLGTWAPIPGLQSPVPSPQSPVPVLQHLADYSHLTLVAAISAFADLGTLLLVYAMAVRLARRMAGQGGNDRNTDGPAPYAAGLWRGRLRGGGAPDPAQPLRCGRRAAHLLHRRHRCARCVAEEGGRLVWVAAGDGRGPGGGVEVQRRAAGDPPVGRRAPCAARPCPLRLGAVAGTAARPFLGVCAPRSPSA